MICFFNSSPSSLFLICWNLATVVISSILAFMQSTIDLILSNNGIKYAYVGWLDPEYQRIRRGNASCYTQNNVWTASEGMLYFSRLFTYINKVHTISIFTFPSLHSYWRYKKRYARYANIPFVCCIQFSGLRKWTCHFLPIFLWDNLCTCTAQASFSKLTFHYTYVT